MTTSILWRPEVNALTTPQSYRPRHVPRATFANDEIAARIALRNPVYNEGIGKGFLLELAEEIKDALINGNQIKIDGVCTCHISFTGRLASPDDPLPAPEESLQVKLYPSRRLIEEVRQAAQLERLPMSEKLPLITSAEDTVLKLDDVLNPYGLLRMTGSDLFFDPQDGVGQCVLEGTSSGRTVQSRFGTISNAEFSFLPNIPSQTDPWNNEYRLSVSTHYTENGNLRTGIYRRMLRTPLAVRLGDDNGILTGSGGTPLVTVTGGLLAEVNSARVRIQALLDAQDGDLRLNLLDMKEGGNAGDTVTVGGNGTYTLTSVEGVDVTNLEVTVNDYVALVKMIRNPYAGRLVDILDVSSGS